MNVCGIDMASAKPSTFAFIDDKLSIETLVDSDSISLGIIAKLTDSNVAVVAIDSPLGFPKGMCCLEDSCPCSSLEGNGRLAERELSKMGISSYYTTKKTIIKPMIYKAIKWANLLRHYGFKVIEIYPYATKVRLFGKPVPNKTKQIVLLKELVSGLGFSSDIISKCNHDQIDAILAAYTGLLDAQGNSIGVGDETESKIVIPKGIEIEGKYCEIAAKRCSQGVFKLDV